MIINKTNTDIRTISAGKAASIVAATTAPTTNPMTKASTVIKIANTISGQHFLLPLLQPQNSS